MSDVANSKNIFLSAEWRDLILLNYVVEPSLLEPFVPKDAKLGSFQGKTYLSLVGFRFCKTKLWGKFAIPLHSEFEEVNLRFYVHRDAGNETRRGVAFVKEIVPKPAVALIARWCYGESYVSHPMKHRIVKQADGQEAEYSWKHGGEWSRLFARSIGTPELPAENSLEQYITEHDWGYSCQKSGGTIEYHVEHIPWEVCTASEAAFTGNAPGLFGKEVGEVLCRPPNSAYIANGSPVVVYKGEEL